MMTLMHSFVLLCLLPSAFSQGQKALDFLTDFNKNYPPHQRAYTLAAWSYATNITTHNSNNKVKAEMELMETMKKYRNRAAKIDLKDCTQDTKRQFMFLLESRESNNQTVTKERSRIAVDMITVYSTATVPHRPDIVKSIAVNKGVTKLRLDKHLRGIMSKSNNTTELAYVWKAWRDSIGPRVKKLYEEYVNVNNLGARENGYEDAGDYRRKGYEVGNLDEIAGNFLAEMQPLYKELHGYIRYKLSKVYKDLVREDDHIPAHLLGNLWAQTWEQTYRHVVPYPEEPDLDATPYLKQKLKNVNGMFKEAEKFFVSIGWRRLPATFWTRSMLEEPRNREVECHASAWDFIHSDTDEPDVRIKMCTQITQNDFNTVHHELGHTYYQMLYWNKPMVYREGANPGFHEAVGDVMTLSVQTPAHLKKVGLLGDVSSTREADINFLMMSALTNIAFLPFAYVMDKWMWGVYDGSITPDQYNTQWWKLRTKYQGIKPPAQPRENDFDPGAKMHTVGDVPYIRYYFARILTFTFHEHACRIAREESGETGPLHHCSIYGSKRAGDALGRMLAYGRSKPWPDVLQEFTGSPNISTDSLKEYFKPLTVWLKAYRAKEKYLVGWERN